VRHVHPTNNPASEKTCTYPVKSQFYFALSGLSDSDKQDAVASSSTNDFEELRIGRRITLAERMQNNSLEIQTG